MVVERMNSFQRVIHRRNELIYLAKINHYFFFLTLKYYKFGDLTE